jgi:hypothetical protein
MSSTTKWDFFLKSDLLICFHPRIFIRLRLNTLSAQGGLRGASLSVGDLNELYQHDKKWFKNPI